MDKGECFNSYQEFLERIQAPIVPGVLGEQNCAATGSLDFCGTPDFPSAQALATKGDFENLAKMSAIPAIVPSTTSGTRKGRKRGVEGEDIDVGAFVSGVPECMYRRSKRVKKYVSIITNGTSRGSCDAKSILIRGRMVLGLVYALQNAGYLVEIDWIVPTLCTPAFYDAIKIKRFDQYVPNAVLAYWLCNPSALRRHWFRLAETKSAEIQRLMGYGYGRCGELATEHIPAGAVYVPSTEYTRDVDAFQKEVLAKYS